MTTSLPSVFDAQPLETGGVDGRIGMDFQDHVATRHCLEMLDDDEISEVWHEFHDDVLVIRGAGDSARTEYIQVKNTDEQLWSISIISKRDKKYNKITKKSEDQRGTSILERNLSNDERRQSSTFRIITSKEVNKDLKVLRSPRYSPAREMSSKSMTYLNTELKTRVGDFTTPAGHDYAYWLEHVLWEVFTSSDLLVAKNMLLVQKLAEKEGYNLKLFECKAVYDQLAEMVRTAGKTKSSEYPEKKKFQRDKFRDDFIELVKNSIVPESIFEGIDEYDVSLDFLRNVILNVHSSIVSEEGSILIADFALISMEDKNRLNGMSDEFCEALFERFGRYFETVKSFLSKPINVELNEMYQDLAVEFNMLLTQHKNSVKSFDEFIRQLCRLLTNGGRVELERKKRYVWMLIAYMYYNCDIGKKK